MNAYYSRSGSDNKEQIAAISRSAVFTAALGGDRFVLPEAGLAAAVQGYFVGSGAVVDSSMIAPIQISSSDPGILQTNSDIGPELATVPLPLPFLLTGTGLIALLALRKRAGLQYLHPEKIS
jgi:hypothetical protein